MRAWRWAPLLPLAALVWLCWRFTVDVPFCDDWQMVDDLALLAHGEYPIARLWRFQNEHRFAFSMPIMLAVATWTRWTIGAQVALNVALAAGAFAMVRQNVAGFAAFVAAALMFSWVQWENWTWGYQVSVFLQLVAGVGVVALLARDRSSTFSSGRTTAAAGALAFVAQYSFGFGQAAWPTGAWMLLRQRRWRELAVWTAAAALATGLYFAGWRTIPAVALHAHGRLLLRVPLFVLLFLGRPLSGGALPWPALLGASGLVLAAVLHYRRPPSTAASRFGWGLIAYALCAATACALGRVAHLEAALASRYTTAGQLFWVGLVVVMAGVSVDERPPLRFVLGGILATSLLAGAMALPEWRAHSDALVLGRRAMQRLDFDDPHIWALQPTDRRLREWCHNLHVLGLSVFRDR
jgi:hypothetical protein